MAINDLLEDKNDIIDYEKLCNDYSWVLEKDRYCILSPDSDGFLCGLFMSYYLNWKVVGFYDGKISVVNQKHIKKDPVFLDIEIFRKEIKSMGHHMLIYNKRHISADFINNFVNCIQPNNLRNYDGNSNFRLKYPLATIHMLISIVAYKNRNITLPDTSIPALFFTDGIFNVLFKYPENVLNWLEYLRIHEEWNPLKKIFENQNSIFSIMKLMDKFFRKRDEISITNERGDRLRISNKDGTPANIENIGSSKCNIAYNARERIQKFIKILSEHTEWKINEKNWDCWNNMKLYQFTKQDFVGDGMKSITIKSFNTMLDKNPLSWAMTSGANIEYTIEAPDTLLN